MTPIYREDAADPAALDGCQIAVIGYGNLGRPMALNLRDSGLNVIVGNMDDAYKAQAMQDGFQTMGLSEAATVADIKLLMLPDEAMPDLYLKHISPTLRPGHTLVFASGYNVTFGFIQPPPLSAVLFLTPPPFPPAIRDSYVA